MNEASEAIRAEFHQLIVAQDETLRDLCHRCNSGVAGTDAETFAAWVEELHAWYARTRSIAQVLASLGFALPADRFVTGTSQEQLAFLNEWANLLPTLEAHFAGPGEPRHVLH